MTRANLIIKLDELLVEVNNILFGLENFEDLEKAIDELELQQGVIPEIIKEYREEQKIKSHVQRSKS